MAGAEGRGAGGGGAPRLGLRGGRRLSAFHCIASRPRISPKILTAVVGKVGRVRSRVWSVAWLLAQMGSLEMGGRTSSSAGPVTR